MSARYLFRGLLGVLLGAGAVVLASLEIYHLVRTGSCASGGPYVSARPCPAGTGGRIMILIGAIFALAPAAVVLFGTRAKGVSGVASGAALAGGLWTWGWLAMGTAAYVAGHGPAAPTDGSGSGSTAVAITFWGIGGVSLLFAVFAAKGARAVDRKMASARPAAATKAPAPPPRPVVPPAATGQAQRLAATLGAVAQQRAEVDDVARRLKQLDELKAMGAVTGDEYAAKRREILGDI